MLNDGEAKGTQRSVEQKETPNYRKSRCYRLEMGKAELWLTISHWVCPLCQEFGCILITSFNSLSGVGGIERLYWKWCRSVSKFLFWDWSPVWPGFKPALSTIYWTFLLRDIIKEEQLGRLGRQPGGFTTAYLANQAMKENYNISKTCWRSHEVGVGQTAHNMRRHQLEEDQWSAPPPPKQSWQTLSSWLSTLLCYDHFPSPTPQ